MGRFTKLPTKEPPSLYCGRCRKWVETREKHRTLGPHPKVWVCGECLKGGQ